MKTGLWLVAVVGLFGCGVQEAHLDEGEVDFESVADAPLLGANGADAADRACSIVLRSLERGAPSCTTAGVCWWTWTGLLDVSAQAVAEGARPRVLFKNIDATRWSSVSATRTTGAPAGFTRYRFRLTRDTLRDGMSATAYSRANVQVAPYLLTTSGARVFDHNRVPGALDSYVVDQAGGFRVGEDAAVCGTDVVVPRALDFQVGGVQQRGSLVAGQRVVLTYALPRLETCRGTHNGFPAWDLRAFVRFAPSGAVVDGTVRGFDAPNGVPSNAGAKSVPFTFEVPMGTTGVEVWFQNTSGAGQNCEAWDSNFSSNYRFPVSVTPPAKVGWVGNPGSSFNRLCQREIGAPSSVVLDGYLQSRACAFVEVDVYVPGLTDAASLQPEALFAQAEVSRDGVPMEATTLGFVGRFGNDYRFHYEVPKTDLYYGPKWQRFDYQFRFSTDGRVWSREQARSVTRDVSFCNPAWGGC